MAIGAETLTARLARATAIPVDWRFTSQEARHARARLYPCPST